MRFSARRLADPLALLVAFATLPISAILCRRKLGAGGRAGNALRSGPPIGPRAGELRTKHVLRLAPAILPGPAALLTALPYWMSLPVWQGAMLILYLFKCARAYGCNSRLKVNTFGLLLSVAFLGGISGAPRPPSGVTSDNGIRIAALGHATTECRKRAP